MIQISLENKDVGDDAPYRTRYKEVYVNTADFGIAGRVAKNHVGPQYAISSMSEMESDILDEDGETL